jgi:predicted nucleotidyltransferase
MVEDAIRNQFMFNIIHLKEVMKIDFIIRKNTEYRKTEFKRRKQVSIEGQKMFFVSIEDLIISKLLWATDSHSELQIKDVNNLLKEKVDMKYITDWVKKLNVSDFFKEITDGSKQ